MVYFRHFNGLIINSGVFFFNFSLKTVYAVHSLIVADSKA